jgi:hypothetical protein
MKMNTSIEHINIALDNKEKRQEYSDYFPFNIQWLDSSYQQTCLPDSPWQKVKLIDRKRILLIVYSIRFLMILNQF